MKRYQIITLFVILFRFGESDANKFNISYSHLDTCKEYFIISGDQALHYYRHYFQISSMNNPKLEDDQRIRLKFFVIAQKDAHILLSEFENQSYLDRVYEIVFGGYGNSRSDIRLQKHKTVVHVMTPNFLSTFDPLPIEIIQKNDGQLIVNIPGFAEPYLKYSDKNPLNIRFVSFSSYGGLQAKWFYDCKLEELTNSEKCQLNQSTEKIEFKKPTTQENPVDSPNKSTKALDQGNRVLKDTNGTDLKNKTEELKLFENLFRDTSVHHYSLGSILMVVIIAVGRFMAIYYKQNRTADISPVNIDVR